MESGGSRAPCPVTVAHQVPGKWGSPALVKGEPLVSHATMESIRQGWEVFAGPDRIGEVAYVRDDVLGVKSGRFVKHVYVIPIELVSDAADGVVDLKVGRDAVTKLEPAK